MRVLLLYPDVGTMLPRDYQHGVGSLLAALGAAGHEAGLLYVHEEMSREELVKRARAFGPGLVGVSSVTNQAERAARHMGWIRDALSVPTIIGGIHATMLPAETIAEPAYDILCVGEGEGALVELADALAEDRDPSGIANLWMKRGSKVIANEVRPLIADLDGLPFVDREAFRFEEVLADQGGKCSMLAGRGCPYRCAFCANRGLAELYRGKGSYARMRSVDSLFAEMREILSRYAVKQWEFHDDIFTLHRDWLREFCERYPGEFSLPFEVNARVETADREALKLLKDAGCAQIRVGVESGSARVRSEVMGRGMAEEKIVRVFADARSVGLKTWSFSMVGLPGETEADAEETVRLNERLNPDHMQVSIFNPYPGTGLWEVCRERGLLPERMADGYFLPETTLNLPEFPAEKIVGVYRRLIQLRDRLAARHNLERDLAGRRVYFDFVDGLGNADVETPEAIYVGEDFFRMGDDVRRVLRVHPPSRVRYRLKVPGNAELRSGLALHPQVLDKPGGDGVIFIVRVGRFARTMKEVVRQTLDPKRKAEDRGWHDFALQLDRWSGKKVYLEFETRTVDPLHPEHNTAGFGHAMIVEKR